MQKLNLDLCYPPLRNIFIGNIWELPGIISSWPCSVYEPCLFLETLWLKVTSWINQLRDYFWTAWVCCCQNTINSHALEISERHDRTKSCNASLKGKRLSTNAATLVCFVPVVSVLYTERVKMNTATRCHTVQLMSSNSTAVWKCSFLFFFKGGFQKLWEPTMCSVVWLDLIHTKIDINIMKYSH